MALRDLVDGEAERPGPSVVGASTHRDHEAGTASRPDDHVLRVRRAVHEVPRAQVPLLAFDEQNSFARNDEEILLIGLPVVHGHRLARSERECIDAELFGLPLAFEVVERYADGAAAVDLTPYGVAHVEDEPSLALRDEPMLGLLQSRLGNHELAACRKPVYAAPVGDIDQRLLGVPVFVPPPDEGSEDPIDGQVFSAGDRLPVGVEAFPGMEPNELVLWVENRRALVAGDTLMRANLERVLS